MKYTTKHPDVEAFEVNEETSKIGAKVPECFNGVLSWGTQGIYIMGYVVNSIHPKVLLAKGIWVIKNLGSGKFIIMTGPKFRATYKPIDNKSNALIK